ncbi:MAG: FAD-dependent oxidoreductase [Trueperaceae bacterium]
MKRILISLALLVLLVSGALGQSTLRELGAFDVIVVGSEPEAIAAAVAAAESGSTTMLISEDEKLGGLFVLGQLNVLDLRTQPVNLQQGLFTRWWRMVGGGHSFDVVRAEAAFATLLDEAGVTVRLGSEPISPVVEAGRVIGVSSGAIAYPATQVIDGTADMDLAAAAGAGFTVGFASLGLEQRMVDTLVFRIDGVDWRRLRQGVVERGRSYASIDDRVAWGHFGGYPAAYQPVAEGLRLRGLNLGLQDDGSVLVNALLIHGIDPFDSGSVAAGRARAEQEAPRVVAYLARELPGFSNARYAGAAPELYIRESRHLEALCTLTVDDVLDHRVTELAIAAGGYPLDVQVLSPFDSGYVFGAPEIYGVRLCVAVPPEPGGLWVVGKSAGYDPIAASSARVVPFGMNVAEAVGLAASMAAARGMSPAVLASDPSAVREVRAQLRERGAYLPAVAERDPAGPADHPHYRAYRLMISRGLAVGGYANDPRLDTPVSTLSYLYLLSNVLARFFGENEGGRRLVDQVGSPEGPLTSGTAIELTRLAECELRTCPAAEASPIARGIVIADESQLTRGEAYSMAAELLLTGEHAIKPKPFKPEPFEPELIEPEANR